MRKLDEILERYNEIVSRHEFYSQMLCMDEFQNKENLLRRYYENKREMDVLYWVLNN